MALAIGTTVGIYTAEVVFRLFLLVPMVPESNRDFHRIVAEQWPKPVAQRKRPGSVRILGLADSFGVAGGAENYHYLLEGILRERGYDVEVVNISVPAYSPQHELALLKRFGARYEPDIVLHAFFVGNDFGNGGRPSLRYRGIDIEQVEGAASWMPQNLTLGRWLSNWARARAEQRSQAADLAQGFGEGSFSRETFLEIERVRIGVCRRPNREGPAWPVTTASLDGVRREVRRLNAEHVLVVHPDQFQVEPKLAEEIADTFGLDRRQYDLRLPQRYLRTYASSRSVRLVDLTDVFRARGSDGGLYLPRDTHYNEAGNQLAAEILADALVPVIDKRLAVINLASTP